MVRDIGKFHPRTEDGGRDRSQRVLSVEPQILEVEANPGTSTQRLALQVGVSHHVVWRTLKEQGFHPYHVSRTKITSPTTKR
jgi:hypothetical protein